MFQMRNSESSNVFFAGLRSDYHKEISRQCFRVSIVNSEVCSKYGVYCKCVRLDEAVGSFHMRYSKVGVISDRNLNGFAGTMARRRYSSERPSGTEVRQKPGPLQTIFGLPPDEVLSY